MGRPPKYATVAELDKIINKYFRECDPHWIKESYWDYPYIGRGKTKRQDKTVSMIKQQRMVLTEQQPYTMAGLAIRLGLSRQGLMEYKAKTEFSDSIKRARDKIGEYNEMQLHKGRNVAGAIFNLKVNWAYYEHREENPPPENPIVFDNNVPTDGPTQN